MAEVFSGLPSPRATSEAPRKLWVLSIHSSMNWAIWGFTAAGAITWATPSTPPATATAVPTLPSQLRSRFLS